MRTTVQVGSATIIAVSDTEQAYPAQGVYPHVDEAAWQPFRELLTAEGTVVLNFGSYVIRADGRTVLVDTGWGPAYQGRLPEELIAVGVAPDTIDAVIFTHLHGDHIGWNMEGEGDQARPRFARARYLLPEA